MGRGKNRQAAVIGWIRRMREAKMPRCVTNELVGPLRRFGTSDEVQWEKL